MSGSLAVPQNAQGLELGHALLMVLCQKEPRPPCLHAPAVAYAVREGRLLHEVCLRGVGFSEGVPRPVRTWTAPRALVAVAALQVAQAPPQGLWIALSLMVVTRPEQQPEVHSCPCPRAFLPHPFLPLPGGKAQHPSPAHLVSKRMVQQ